MDEIAVRPEYELPVNIEDLSKFVLVGREKLVAVRAEIRAIDKVGLAKEVRKQKLQEAQSISEAVLDAEMRIGQLMKDVPKAQGFASIIRPTGGSNTKKQVIEDAGFTKTQVQRFEALADNPEVVEQVKAEARENDDIVSRSSVLKKIKEKKRKSDLERQVQEIEEHAPEMPEGVFDVIVIDPAWSYGTGYDSAGRRCANPYPEMTQTELKQIQIPASENCVMFLWTTHKFIWDAKELLDTWGFEYRNMLVWDKKVMGMGNLFRMRCEFCLVGIKGKPTFKDVHNLEDIIEEKRREHSRKPEAFYEMVNELCVGRKLDYFCRTKRDGWEVFGNDTGKFDVA